MKPLLAIEQDPRLPGLGVLEGRLQASGLPVAANPRLGREPRRSAGCRLERDRRARWGTRTPGRRRAHTFSASSVACWPTPWPRGSRCSASASGRRCSREHSERRCARRPSTKPAGSTSPPTPETAGDPLLGHLENPTGVFHWRQDTFELPARATLLASSDLTANQAFRLGDAWGIQFHPEVDYSTFAFWQANHPGACEEHGIDERGAP